MVVSCSVDCHAQVEHTYEDKYLLTEFLCNMGLASQLTCLGQLGVRAAQLAQLKAWADAGNAVTLRFRTEERCAFLRAETREQEAPTKTVLTSSGGTGTPHNTVTASVVTTVKEFLWRLDHAWELLALRGVGGAPADVLRLAGRKGCHTMRTSSEQPPHPELRCPAAQEDLDVSWLLQQLPAPDDAPSPTSDGATGPVAAAAEGAGAAEGATAGGGAAYAPFVPRFAIDRSAAECATPRRNPQAEAAVNHAAASATWFAQVHELLVAAARTHLERKEAERLDLLSLAANGEVFVPVLPVLTTTVAAASESDGSSGSGNSGAVCLNVAQVAAFLGEEARSLADKRRSVEAAFGASALLGSDPDKDDDTASTSPLIGKAPPLQDQEQQQRQQQQQLFTAAEAWVAVVCSHAAAVANKWQTAVAYVEAMLYAQLRAAIGQAVTPQLFDTYMAFHRAHRLFAPAYAPKPFCVAVRRSPHHSPEGTLSIEATNGHDRGHGRGSNGPQPVETLAALRSPLGAGATTTGFQVSAATRVEFTGPRYLHAWLRSGFGGADACGGSSGNEESVALVARARQFCSFVVVVGTLTSQDTLAPTHAFVVKNRDEVSIPLDLATLPTAGEFRDAVASLAPQQQAFAKAVRGFQLASTLFGVAVLQVKPALEQVLNLPFDALTKEIALTNSLVELFVKYQVKMVVMVVVVMVVFY